MVNSTCRKKLCLPWVTDTMVQRAVGLLKTNGVGSGKAVRLYPTVGTYISSV